MRRMPAPCRFRVVGLVVAAVALAAAAGSPAPGAAGPAVMPAHDISVGMTGVGKTVIIGTAVVPFNVRVLGILRNAGPAGDLVLFRASGRAIQSVGGIAAGMSGSPIYLQGKIAGALSYTFEGSDPTIGLFTPIEDMLRVLPRAPRAGLAGHHEIDAARTYAVAPFAARGRIVRRIAVASAGAATAARGAGDALVAIPAATPLFVSGVGGAGLTALTQILSPMGLAPMAGGAQADVPASLPLEPGSAIGVALAKGDITAYAIGTMTYRDGERMLAFGHAFTGIGPSSYLLMNATIFQVVRGQQQNIKVGAVGAPVGIVSQDRPAGIGGTIGVMPLMFGVRVHVTDTDSGGTRNFNFQVIPSSEIAPLVVPVGALGAIERALDRSGRGTADVRMVLYGRRLPHPVVRENMFYGSTNLAAHALAELPRAMNLLFDNDFTDVRPTGVDLDVRVTSAQRTATIVDAEGPHGPVAPGDTIHVRVTVRPFRAAPQTEDVALTIPAKAVDGPAMLVVRGGGSVLGGAAAAVAAAAQPASGTGARTLADEITAFETADKNTDVVIEMLGGLPLHVDADGAAAARPAAQWTTPWVVRGRLQLPIVIKGGPH
jgi:hypothetical protein